MRDRTVGERHKKAIEDNEENNMRTERNEREGSGT